MQNKPKEKINSEVLARRAHSPGHQPFNPKGDIKINRTGKKKK